MPNSRRNFTAHTSSASAADQRKRDLGHIHQGKKDLQWTDDDYRFHLRNLTGKSSSADLSAAGRRKVLDHMAACGWHLATKPFKPFGQAEKIEWLWKKLGEAKGITDTSKAALLTFVGRTTSLGVADLKFLPVAQASTVIEALKSWLDRAKKGQSEQNAAHRSKPEPDAT